MAAELSTTRKLSAFLYVVLNFGPVTYVSTPLLRWADGWWLNRASITMFTVTNVAITTGNEVLSRTLFAPVSKNPENNQFLVRDDHGRHHVNQQSLINILMTLFASLIGGPVYFFRKRSSRFLFFTGFGVFNSVLSQCISSISRLGMLSIVGGRLLFDIFYNGTLKFLMFEIGRPSLIRWRKSFVRVGYIRIAQDFVMTLFKVVLLSCLGLKG